MIIKDKSSRRVCRECKSRAFELQGGMSKSSDVSTGIKAMVTDENGEISCSVDETNRIRALLGLRPLNNEKGSNEREAVQNFHANRDKERRYDAGLD